MLLSLITRTSYRTLVLPPRKEGVYSLKDSSDKTLFTVNGNGSDWVVSCSTDTRFMNVNTLILKNEQLTRVYVQGGIEKAYLYAEESGRGYGKYVRCQVPDTATYSVGRDSFNDIVCKSYYISDRHFQLICQNRSWRVNNLGGKSGTYVNGKRVGKGSHSLAPGDMVSVMNQKFIVLPGLLAFNVQNIDITKVKSRFMPLNFNVSSISRNHLLEEEVQPFYFPRKPRIIGTLSDAESITVAPPPASESVNYDTSSGMISAAPALISGATMAAVGNPLVGIGMAASSALSSKLNKDKAEKLQLEKEEKRKEKYEEYLKNLDRNLRELNRRQTDELRKLFPEPRQELLGLLNDETSMWIKRPEHSDFLALRIGIGDIPMKVNISFPQTVFDTEDDPLKAKLEAFQEKELLLHNVPILLEMNRFLGIGISGEKSLCYSFTGLLIMQLVSFIGYDDLKLCLIGPMYKPLQILQWLPHTWDDAGMVHYYAENREELDQLLPALEQELKPYQSSISISSARGQKEIVFLITDMDLAQSGVLTRLLFNVPYEHVHVISIADHTRNLPSRMEAVIGLKEGKGKMVWRESDRKQSVNFSMDSFVDDLTPKLVSIMANRFLDLRINSAVMPTVVPFLDMFDVQDIAYLNISYRWDHSSPSQTLKAPIGIGEDGNLCMLDISEKADGPHGLIAGTTGSGKSEFIMSYILSMAVCYSPDDIAFLLIDYKGGGMAQAFADLPHTAGIITNLDGNEIRRSMLSIKSELLRRQSIFSTTMRQNGLTSLSISKYRDLYRSGKAAEPMPHLLIITDEFAELKSQEPEFMKEMISAARVGRSLGVHLILATQQPAGVVDDQIWSNTNFRICLHVQDPKDSQDVIKCPDAAFLVQAGSFYKQVGHAMTKAQSAWSGADYTPDKSSLPSCGIDILNHAGAVIRHEPLPSSRKAAGLSQAAALTKYIKEFADREHILGHPLWKPVLEKEILLSDLYSRYQINISPWVLDPVLGELDDPAHQRRDVVRMPLSEGKNVIVYGGIGSGKRMLLTTILEDLLEHHSPDELHVYILDYFEDGLTAFLKAPQVGDVLLGDEDEKLTRFIKLLKKQIDDRKKVLGGRTASTPLSERLQTAGICQILVIIHNLAALKDRMDDQIQDLIHLLKEGPRWGIHFLATVETSSGLGINLQDRFSRKYVLQMDHDDDYMSLLGRTDGMKPSSVLGRGLIRIEKDIFEFQTATAENEPELMCEDLKNSWSGASAEPVRIMPERVTCGLLAQYLDGKEFGIIPVGLDPETIEPAYYSFNKRTVHMILGRKADIMEFLSALIPMFMQKGYDIVALETSNELGKLTNTSITDEKSEARDVIERLFSECRRAKEAITQGKTLDQTPRMILIPATQDLLMNLDEESCESLRAMLERARPEWKWTFIVCDSPQSFNKLRYNDEDKIWIDASVNTENGIYLGGGISSQMMLHVEGDSRQLYQSIAYPLGYIVSDAEAKRIHFLSS